MSVASRIKIFTGIFSGNLGGKSEINSSKQISSWAWCKSASEAWFLCTKMIRKPCRCLRSLSSKAKFTSAGGEINEIGKGALEKYDWKKSPTNLTQQIFFLIGNFQWKSTNSYKASETLFKSAVHIQSRDKGFLSTAACSNSSAGHWTGTGYFYSKHLFSFREKPKANTWQFNSWVDCRFNCVIYNMLVWELKTYILLRSWIQLHEF